MKKIVLSIFGIFALAACGGDVYHDIDKQNNGLEAANTASDDGSGGYTTFSDDGDYRSFWNINTRGQHEMFYRFTNWTGDWGNPAILDFRITPYVGLAYFDGTHDGDYRDVTSGTVENFNTVPPGTYPNLYDPTGNEIGNFMPTLPFTLDGSGIPSFGGTVVLEMQSGDHCHVVNANANSLNPAGVFFDLSAPPPPFVPALPQEEELLKDYGKVFFYFWEAVDPVTTIVVASGYIMPHCDTNNAAYWTNSTVTANLPGGGIADLYYNIYSNDTGNASHEVVLERGTFPHEQTFFHTVGAQVYEYKVELETFLSGTSDPVSTLKLSIVY